jgi:hypothetical protein
MEVVAKNQGMVPFNTGGDDEDTLDEFCALDELYSHYKEATSSASDNTKSTLAQKKQLETAEEIRQDGLGNLRKRNLATPTADSEEDGVNSANKKKMARISGGSKASDNVINDKWLMREERMNLKEKRLQQKEENRTLLLRNRAEALELKKQHLEILKKQQENAELEKKAAMEEKKASAEQTQPIFIHICIIYIFIYLYIFNT